MKLTDDGSQFKSSSLDEAYETNDLDYQLFFVTTLIGEALLDMENARGYLSRGDTDTGLALLECTQQRLGEFFVDAQLDTVYN